MFTWLKKCWFIELVHNWLRTRSVNLVYFQFANNNNKKEEMFLEQKKKSLMNQLDVLELFFYLFHIYIIHCEWIRATYSPSIFYSIWKNSPCVLICFSQTTINWSESFSSPRVRFLSINLYSDSSSSFSRLISN